MGNKIASYKLTATQKQFIIPIQNFENGIYEYRFSIGGKIEEGGKIVIVNH